MADESWEDALKLVQEGKTREAHTLFEKIVSGDVHNVSAWFWYAKTGASEMERTRILQNCLRFNPDSGETRDVLGLAPVPQPEPPILSPASQRTANSLTFRAPGSAAPEADSGESTKPIKAYVPAPVPAAPAPAMQSARVPLWLVLLIGLLLIMFLGIAAWVAFQNF